ncbi:unnamed protein product [Amoebophrya sp. A120]|nr:unnamed protein product [Amoebophrya sp. A120]|eukprot:GSA120T00011087001.1
MTKVPILIESKYSGYGILWAGTGIAVGAILLLVTLSLWCYYSKMYKVLPGWGPIVRFDNQLTEEARYRQEVFKSAREQAGFSRPAEGIWRKQPGTLVEHPVYGAITMHGNFNALKEERRKDPFAPKDEQHEGREALIEDPASLFNHKLVAV